MKQKKELYIINLRKCRDELTSAERMTYRYADS
jgi:hypothetical protein